MIFLKSIAAILSAVVMLVSSTGITKIFPHLAVIPDMLEVGADYISLDRNGGAVSKKELKEAISQNEQAHPFVLAEKESFDVARQEYKNGTENGYANALIDSVLDNADALLDLDIYPVMPYELDEEDSILPISREVINRMVILGCAWQLTGDEKYADRAWLELENVCGYGDWQRQKWLLRFPLDLIGFLII